MSTRTIELDPWNPRKDLVEEAAEALRKGQILLLPTDTTWALICRAQEKSSVEKLTRLREQNAQLRGEDASFKHRPLALMCPDLSSIGKFTLMDQNQFRLVKRLLPGPYTILLPASHEVPRLLREKRKSIGVRLPAFPIVEEILLAFGEPVFTTTARNEQGELLEAPEGLPHDLLNAIDVIIQSDPIYPQESTVVDATTAPPEIVRVGIGPVEDHWVPASNDD